MRLAWRWPSQPLADERLQLRGEGAHRPTLPCARGAPASDALLLGQQQRDLAIGRGVAVLALLEAIGRQAQELEHHRFRNRVNSALSAGTSQPPAVDERREHWSEIRQLLLPPRRARARSLARRRLSQIAAPTLVLAGGLDMTGRPELCRAVAELISGAQCEVMEQESHQPFQEAPDEWNACVNAFWRDVEAAA
jgi:pimeloyl-ACP methyl ester carboxylesterase